MHDVLLKFVPLLPSTASEDPYPPGITCVRFTTPATSYEKYSRLLHDFQAYSKRSTSICYENRTYLDVKILNESGLVVVCASKRTGNAGESLSTLR